MKNRFFQATVVVLALYGAVQLGMLGVQSFPSASAQTEETIDKADMEKALEDIDALIRSAESDYSRAQATLTNQSAQLGNIPTQFASYITAIDALAGTTTWEEVIQEKKALYVTRYQAVKGDVDTVVAAFGG